MIYFRSRSRTGHSRSGWFWLVALAAVLTSCMELGEGPRISEFRASPSSVSLGEKVVLSWQVDNLDSGKLVLHAIPKDSSEEGVSLGEVTRQSSMAVIANETTTYRLTASGPSGTTSRETVVSVVDDSSVDDGDPPPDNRCASSAASAHGSAAPAGWEPLHSGWSEQDSDFGTLQTAGCNCLLFLIAGQSNAVGYGTETGGSFPTSETEQPGEGVWMLTSEREWVQAQEPTHEDAKHSFGLRFGKEVRAATSMDVYLVPAAVGGSALNDWQPGDKHFEEALSRSQHASESLGGAPMSAVLWLQGETESKYDSKRTKFIEKTDNVFQGFHEQLLGNPEILFVQLSKRLFHGTVPNDNIEGHNLAYQVIREAQRLMEAGATGSSAGTSSESSVDRPYYHMVVSHDLPMSDVKHLSAEGQRYLGQRLAHAYLNRIRQSGGQNALGPRLESISMPDECTVLVDTTMSVNQSSTYDGYFSLFQDGNPKLYSSIGRDATDPTRIRIEVASPLSGDIEVRYMPPDDTPLYGWTSEAVHAVVGDLRLPLPAFNGPVEPLPTDSFPGARMSEE